MSKQYFTVDEWKSYKENGGKNFEKGKEYSIELRTYQKTGKGSPYAQTKAMFLGFCKMTYAGIEDVVFAKFKIGKQTKFLRLFPNYKGTSYVAVFGLSDTRYTVIDVAQ